MQALRRQLVDSLRAFSNIYRNPRLRRLQLAWIGSSVGTWGYVIALMVYAYRQGGPAGVGLVGLIRWFPAAVAAPFGGMIGDRFPRLRVMVVSDLVRAGALAAAAAAIVLDTPAVSVYLLAVLVMLVSQAFQPAESALLPTLAESPEELAAANVANSTIEACHDAGVGDRAMHLQVPFANADARSDLVVFERAVAAPPNGIPPQVTSEVIEAAECGGVPLVGRNAGPDSAARARARRGSGQR